MKTRARIPALAALVLAGCASSPWGDAGIHEERVFRGESYDRIHSSAVAVVRELRPESHRVVSGDGTIRAEGEIGTCEEHALCPRLVPGDRRSRLWTRLQISFTRRLTSTEIDVSAEFEAMRCRSPESPDCRRTGVSSTGRLEEEIVRRIRERVRSAP